MKLLRCAAMLAVVVSLGVLSSCDVQLSVFIDVAANGNGEVVVVIDADQEAVGTLGSLDAGIDVDDVAQAGWTVAEVEKTGGRQALTLTKAFASPAALGDVVREVDSTELVLSDVLLEVKNTFATTDYEFEATVQTPGELELFGDNELSSVLDGYAIGWDPADLDEALENANIDVTATVKLPDQEPQQVTTRFESDIMVSNQLSARSRIYDRDAMRWLLVGGGVILLSLGLILVRPKRVRTTHDDHVDVELADQVDVTD